MAEVEIAGVQMDCVWESPLENLRAAEEALGRAAASGVSLAVLPEMFATGFSMDAEPMAGHADRVGGWLSEAARRHGLWVLAGLAVPGAGRPLNEARLVRPDGTVALRYHKIHPFSLAGEPDHFDSGAALHTARVEGLRVTPLICYDLRFPELFRARAGQTDLFVVLANWPAPRRAHWSTLLAARAIECQAYVLGVNRVGEGDRLRYLGDSALYDPLGERLASMCGQPGLVRGCVDTEAVRSTRARYSFLADRRPSIYRGLD